MPDVNEIFGALEAMSPGELEIRRRELVQSATSTSVDDLPLETLRELAAITAQLRRKTAGPPKSETAKKARKNGATKKASVDDIFGAL